MQSKSTQYDTWLICFSFIFFFLFLFLFLFLFCFVLFCFFSFSTNCMFVFVCLWFLRIWSVSLLLFWNKFSVCTLYTKLKLIYFLTYATSCLKWYVLTHTHLCFFSVQKHMYIYFCIYWLYQILSYSFFLLFFFSSFLLFFI